MDNTTIRKGFLTFSWALYDLANQFFALNVVSLYLPRWLTIKKGSPEILYSLAFGASMILVAFFAPVLGTISDIKNRHKPFLIFFTLLSIAFTVCMGFTDNIFLVLAFFAIANFGCQEAVIFYNSLMREIAPPNRLGLISGLGRMFGYTGAILALYFTKPVALKMGYGPVFVLTGILFLIFSLPCMIFVKETGRARKFGIGDLLQRKRVFIIFRRLKTIAFESYKFGEFRSFLMASFFGLCAVSTIMLFMAVYAGKVFGLDEVQLINLIGFSTVFAILGSIISGFLSDIIGYKRSLIGVFCLWGICILSGGLLDVGFSYLIGGLTGFNLGATWAVARALVIKLVPEEKMGEAFGLFNVVSYIAGIVGPMFWGIMVFYLSRFGEKGYRAAFLSLIPFVAIGIIFLLKMKKQKE